MRILVSNGKSTEIPLLLVVRIKRPIILQPQSNNEKRVEKKNFSKWNKCGKTAKMYPVQWMANAKDRKYREKKIFTTAIIKVRKCSNKM